MTCPICKTEITGNCCGECGYTVKIGVDLGSGDSMTGYIYTRIKDKEN
jgi:hypothetical protein